MQRQHADFLLVELIGCKVPTLAKANEIVDVVPVFDYAQSLLNFVPQLERAEVPAQKYRFAAFPNSDSARYVGCCTFSRVKRRKMSSVCAVPVRNAVVYLII